MRVLLGCMILSFSGIASADPLRPIDPDDTSSTSMAVVVGDVPLAHTGQFLPCDMKGGIVGKGDVAAQVGKIVEDLGIALGQAGSGLDRLVKLNVCVAATNDVAEVRKALAAALAGKARPAVAYVVGALSHPDARVAVDAVAAAEGAGGGETVNRLSCAVYGPPGFPQVAVLPAGGRVHISGQAVKGKDLAESTRMTLEGLKRTLDWLGRKESHVAQVRMFGELTAERAAVEAEIARVFSVPLVFIEGDAGALIEIELVAAAGKPDPPAPPPPDVEFLTPPWMQSSPVYSKVVRTNRGGAVYVSGLYGATAADVPGEIREAFGTLKDVLAKAGSDLRHLVKATYYVIDADTAKALAEVRPEFYDPKSPPAASRATTAGVGREGRRFTMDMIAVPAR